MNSPPLGNTHKPAFENAAQGRNQCQNPINRGRVYAATAVALLVIGALGLSGHLSPSIVGSALAGIGCGVPLLSFAYDYMTDQSTDTCVDRLVIIAAVVSLVFGVRAAVGCPMSSKVVAPLAVAGTSLFLALRLPDTIWL